MHGLTRLFIGGTLLTCMVACDTSARRPEPLPGTSVVLQRLYLGLSIDKVDLLLDVDNSRSMADKQRILALAVPRLVAAFASPRCVDPLDGDLDLDGDGVPDAIVQPTDPFDPCPIVTLGGTAYGTQRELAPVRDLHIGVVTSSLGGHGSDSCTGADGPTDDDRGHLVSRSDAASPGLVLDTYPYGDPVDLGFLAWDPTAALEPPGDASLPHLTDDLRRMVTGAGEVGCGFEAQLESWYRFLVDPSPYDTIEVQTVNGADVAVLLGTDDALLAERRAFLRPDSLLAIVMLTDENDCSIRDGGQYFFAAQTYAPGTTSPYHLPKPRAACATDPNDSCCRSCGQPPAAGCDTSGDVCGDLEPLDDSLGLRCFDQKRRFGIDFLQPLDRYVTALTATLVPDRQGNLFQNPLFTDLDQTDGYVGIRDPSLVLLVGIVGVPWQDVARRDANGVPSLLAGLDPSGHAVGGLQNGDELAANGTWDIILGDLLAYVPPSDPLMIESIDPRVGTNPLTGDPLVGAGPNAPTNPINGKERSIPNKSDLQYACILALPSCVSAADCGGAEDACIDGHCARDCTSPNIPGCECGDPANDNPLCWNGSAFGTDQRAAKAYPGRRELHVLKQLGDQGLVASICPAQMDDATAPDFGYSPAVQVVVDWLEQRTRRSHGVCMPHSLAPNAAGQVPCGVIEAKWAVDGCTGGGGSRRPVAPENQAVADAVAADAPAPGWNEYCEILQLAGAELDPCQNDPSDAGSVHGWCYVDPSAVPPLGSPEVVASCPSTVKRLVRFVGQGQGAPGATLFLACGGG
ncbi:MAG: hypothetical protein HY908_09100 [Myxococcales bacterium]|nr:hypothetical protein [Myxococcales bacterium]